MVVFPFRPYFPGPEGPGEILLIWPKRRTVLLLYSLTTTSSRGARMYCLRPSMRASWSSPTVRPLTGTSSMKA